MRFGPSVFAALLLPLQAVATERVPFDAAAFAAAQQAGKPIIVHVFATWCETCAAQKNVLDKLGQDPAFSGFSTFVVDYDKQKDAMRTFNVHTRSVILVFKGATEVARVEWKTSEAPIKAALEKAL